MTNWPAHLKRIPFVLGLRVVSLSTLLIGAHKMDAKILAVEPYLDGLQGALGVGRMVLIF